MSEKIEITGKPLFRSRKVNASGLIAGYQKMLDEYAESVPFTQIKNFTKQTDFVTAIEHATYEVTVQSQVEERRLIIKRRTPYDGNPPIERLPRQPKDVSTINPWQIEFQRAADFEAHTQSKILVDTCEVYNCPDCDAKGRVTCDDCKGNKQVTCGDCDGKTQVTCGTCKGSTKVRRTRVIVKEVACNFCVGKGCDRCNRGFIKKNVSEDFTDTCCDCKNGKVDCKLCKASGKVTCKSCHGNGWLICRTCVGKCKLMNSVSAEQSETPKKDNQHCLPLTFPNFKKVNSPTSKLDGEKVFFQDNTNIPAAISKFGFSEEEAAGVLSKKVDECRRFHRMNNKQVIIRQQISIERCLIVEYRYRYESKEYTFYLNPAHQLVEDIDGPIQAAKQNFEEQAAKAHNEKRYEEAYRLIMRGLCMDETKEAEQQLRDKILKSLFWFYLGWGSLVAIIIASAFYVLGSSKALNEAKGSTGGIAIMSLLIVVVGARLISRDLGLTFIKYKDRILAAITLGFFASMSTWVGAVYSRKFYQQHDDQYSFIFSWNLIILATLLGWSLIRLKERKRRSHIEECREEFKPTEKLVSYINGLTGKELSRRPIFIILASVVIIGSGHLFWLSLPERNNLTRTLQSSNRQAAQWQESQEASSVPPPSGDTRATIPSRFSDTKNASIQSTPAAANAFASFMAEIPNAEPIIKFTQLPAINTDADIKQLQKILRITEAASEACQESMKAVQTKNRKECLQLLGKLTQMHAALVQSWINYKNNGESSEDYKRVLKATETYEQEKNSLVVVLQGLERGQ